MWGSALMVIGGALTGVQQFDGPIPINKNLWTLSYVCLMGGWAFFVLILLYFLVDVMKLWNGAPFYFVGMNSILIYVLHEMLGQQVPWGIPPWHTTHAKNMAQQFGAMVTWVLYAYYCYRQKFFVVL